MESVQGARSKGVAITTDGVQIGRYHFDREEYGVGKLSDGKPIRIPNGTHTNANVRVTIVGNNADISVSLNGRPALSWKGELKNLSECKEGDFYDGQSRQGLVVGTFQGGSNQFTRLRYRIFESDNSTEKSERPLVKADSTEKTATAPAALPDTPYHKTALWILEQQGQLEITTLGASGEIGRAIMIYRKEQVPPQDFRITKINFYRQPIDDSHIRKLAEYSIEDTVDLNLMETKVSDVGLQHVAKLKNLRSLNIASTKVNGTGFRYLADLKHLRELNCNGSPIQDSASRYLKNTPSLSVLALSDTEVGDDGMIHISQLGSLGNLKINGTNVTDRGLRTLSSMKQLRMLYVSEPKITSSAVSSFRKNISSCEVVFQTNGINVVGRWKHSVNSGKEYDLTIFAEGGVNNPKGPVTWNLRGNQLTMRWPSKDAPGGVWIDRCTVSPDGKSYSGKNQKGYTIRGTRSK